MNRRVVQAGAGLAITVFISGLALFAYTGTFSRFWADDYCYSATLKQLGLIRGLVDWYQTSGNRISTLAVVAFADLFGPGLIRFIPLAVLALWVAAWCFFFFQARRLFRWPVAGYWLVLLAVVEVYFATLLAPDRLQTIYWRMGTFHYTLPMPLLLINLGFLAGVFRLSRIHLAWIMPLSGFLGFFAAGLSETFAAMQTGLLLLAVAGLLVWFRHSPRHACLYRHGILLLAAPLAGSVMMMSLMSLAPANAWRQAVMPPPENPLLIVPYTLRFAGDFILYTVRGQIIPFLVYGLVVGLVGLLAVPTEKPRLTLRAWMVWAGISLLGMAASIVFSFAPSAFANLSYPAGRALMPGSFALLTGLGAVAFLLGLAARQSLLPIVHLKWPAIAAAVLLAALSLYPFRAAAVVGSDIARLSVRAERWDARNGQILSAIIAENDGNAENASNAPGAFNLDIQVQQVDVVQSLEDMGPNSSHWINRCAAVFYGVHSITAKP